MEFNRSSSVEWVSMDFNVPINNILREYNEIKDSLIIHRPEDNIKIGVPSHYMVLISDKTNSHWEYRKKGLKPFITDIGKKCPNTIN